jgi:hypothetical protein
MKPFFTLEQRALTSTNCSAGDKLPLNLFDKCSKGKRNIELTEVLKNKRMYRSVILWWPSNFGFSRNFVPLHKLISVTQVVFCSLTAVEWKVFSVVLQVIKDGLAFKLHEWLATWGPRTASGSPSLCLRPAKFFEHIKIMFSLPELGPFF